MKTLLVIATLALSASCATIREALPEQKIDTHSAPLEGAIKNDEKITSKKDLIAENHRIDIAYEAAIKKNNCTKQDWKRYEFGEYFANFARIGKTTPYDVVNGDEFERRHLSAYSFNEFFNNYANYAAQMPDPIADKFGQEFESEAEKMKNQKAVFNALVKRDFECYKKLK